MTENEKWQREIDIEKQYGIYQSLKNRRAGDQPPTGPCNRLCWWYFQVAQSQQSKRH